MTVLFSAVIQGQPLGKERGRSFAIQRADGKMSTRVKTADKTRNWETSAAWQFKKVMGFGRSMFPLRGPIGILAIAVSARPKNRPQGYPKESWIKDRVWRISKPDGDNVLKIIADTLTKARVIHDDCEIASWGPILCMYAAVGEGPCVEVVVTDLPPTPRGSYLVP